MSGNTQKRSKSAAGRQTVGNQQTPKEQSQSAMVPLASRNQSASVSSSLHEVSIIDTMTKFLEANGAAEVDRKVLRNMAEMLSKRFNDTSSGTVQDVTMDNSYGVGYRSPCVSLQQYQGSTSPAGQGRSVREFEEQMATLRKENFNLKLRLYFIEESIPGYQQNPTGDGQETLQKQLIDTKVEMEILRKEIEEKREILNEAAQAMSRMEQMQKDTEMKGQAIIDELNHKIHCLEMEREMEKSHNGNEIMNDLLGRSDISENINAIQRIRELEGIVKLSEGKLIDFQDQISKLHDSLAKRDEIIKEYEEKVKELVFQNSELLETIDNRQKEVASAERTFRGLRKSNAELKEENAHLIDALRTTQENFRKELSNMKSCERQMREQQDTLSKMQSQLLREEIQELKTKLADKMCMLQDLTQTHEQSRHTIQNLIYLNNKQEQEIKKLKNNNASQSSAKEDTISTTGGCMECTGLCRSLSDTEALNNGPSKIAQKQKMETIIAEQETLIRSLKAEVKKKTANLQNLVNNELWEKNREIERLTKLINKDQNEGRCNATASPTSPTFNEQSFSELQQSFSDMEYQKALERNKLLQKKVEILIQRLGVDRNNEMQIVKLRNEVAEARNDAEIAERFRRECMNVCATLSQRLEELAGFLNSLLKQKDVLGVLGADRRKAMRKAVDRSLDLSKSLNMTLSLTNTTIGDQSFLQLSNLSDMFGNAEALEDCTFNSHEDLNTEQQSIEKLKAENKALKKELDKRRSVGDLAKKDRRSLPTYVMENQSESEAWSEPDRKVSLARIGLDEHSTSMAKSVASATARASPAAKELETDSESDALNQSRSNKTAARTMERMAQLEQMISQRDDRILEIQCQLVDADNRLKKENLKVIDMTQELTQLHQRNEELHADLIAIGSVAHDQSLAGHQESLLHREIEEKTHSLQKIQEERDRLALEARFAEIKIKTIEDEMKEIKTQHDNALEMAQKHEQEKLEKLQKELNAVMEQRLAEQQRLHEETLARDWIARDLYEEGQKRLKELQRQLKETNSTIEYLNENEQEMKQTLIDNELAMRAVKKQLDESTLQASKAVLERTKALNEKLNLEKRIQELNMQLQAQDAERSALQQKVVELEGIKSVLQEQIVSSQTSKLNNSSDVSHSGYTSEEVPAPQINGNTKVTNESIKGVKVTQSDSVTAQRLNNPSPDLGIESDVGREGNKGIKEEKSDNAVMQQEVKSFNLSSTSNSTHDCAKVDQENAELRRKLNRTKRAFEDTYHKLRVSNQKKAQVEKDIKNQILKTHNLLRNVRSNMENEL